MTIREEKLNFAYNPGLRPCTSHLILHHAAANGTVRQVHSWHLSRGWAGIAYHYYVGKDGQIWRGRPEGWRGGHTQGYNGQSVGVCFEGNFEVERMADSQIQAGQALVADITARCPGLVIAGHNQLNATACPGKYFPFIEITIPGKKEEKEMAVSVKEPVYGKLEDVPDWARKTVEKLLEKGFLKGDGQELAMSYSFLRGLVVNDRAGLYD